MTSKIKLLVLFLIFYTNISVGQYKPNIDSLIQEINIMKDGVSKLELIINTIELQKEYHLSDSSFYLIQKAKAISEKIAKENKDPKTLKQNKIFLAKAYLYSGEWQDNNDFLHRNLAIKDYLLAIKTNKEVHDLNVYGLILIRLASKLNNKNSRMSMKCYKLALNIYEQLGDKNKQAKIQYSIGKTIGSMRNSKEAMDRMLAALEIYKQLENHKKYAEVAIVIAGSLSNSKKPIEADKYYKLAYHSITSLNDSIFLSGLYASWALNDLILNDTNTAHQKLITSFKISKKHGSQLATNTLNHIRFGILKPRKKYKDIIINLQEQLAIIQQINDSVGICKLAFDLGNAYIDLNKAGTQNKDVNKSKNLTIAIAYFNNALDYIPHNKNNPNTNQILLFSSLEDIHNSGELINGELILSPSRSLSYLEANILKKLAFCHSQLKNNELAYTSLSKSIEIRDSLDKSNQANRIEKNAFEQTKSKQAVEIELQNERINNESKRKEIYAYGFGIFTFISLILAISIYRGYRSKIKLNKAFKTIQDTQEKLINQEKLSFEEKLSKQKAEQEMQLLRAQMNPHFLFNSLNSIHNCILQKDTLTASSSLTKFSRLVRNILESSRQAIVTLKSELATLELYMQLEQMRFSTKFEYKIIIESGIAEDEIVIPPLLLQPFIENSIWHGLLPSGTQGLIEISIRKNGDKILFTIVDNGIGRDKSKELNKNKEEQHTSYGLEITKERLQIHNQLSEQNSPFKIIDLFDSHGKATGTKVEFELIIQKNAA